MHNNEFKDAVSYVARLERFHELDKEREDMMKDLIAKYQDLQQRFEKKCNECDDQARTRDLYRADANEANKKLQDIQRKTDVNSFVYAIIDGDGAVFREDWIAKGEDGGAMAAHQLHTNIKKHLQEVYPDANVESWNVIVQVALNLEGLSRKLKNVALTKSVTELPGFARGFSRVKGLFSFVDVGYGKEQADFKVREMLRAMVYNLQCKHIIFGPCHNKGYLAELGPYKHDKSISTKLTLLETTPAPPEFRELGFCRTRFPQVFRSEPLPDGPLPVASTLSPSRPAKFFGIASSWIGTGPSAKESKGSTAMALRPAPPATLATLATPTSHKYYLVNSSGERVDEQFPYDARAEQRFRDRCMKEARGPCNRFHLTGTCEEQSCTYYHGPYLDAGEKVFLRTAARGIPCFHGRSCRNFDCYWGHHCKYGQQCKRLGCKFSNSHDMDLIPSEKVFEDGTREKVRPVTS
ncbi:hypothetical protein AAE478_009259 [Parahypoxylon ruwenzoriense]